jgi:hypothetical protein
MIHQFSPFPSGEQVDLCLHGWLTAHNATLFTFHNLSSPLGCVTNTNEAGKKKSSVDKFVALIYNFLPLPMAYYSFV